MLLAVDPGADTGWAVFDPGEAFAARGRQDPSRAQKGRLVACGLATPRSLRRAVDAALETDGTTWPRTVTEVHGERPKYYPNSKVPASDIVTLAIRLGEATGSWSNAGAKIRYYEPAEWKGGVSKTAHHPRIWVVLDPSEQEIAKEAAKGIAPSKRNNMLDAIALGLFALGRVRVGGV